MVRSIIFVILVISIFYAFYLASRVHPQAATIGADSTCDEKLWEHIYHPGRLQVLAQCKTVNGIIESKKAEADGDYHIRLKLDAEYNDLLNQSNLNNQHGDLVLEPICLNKVTQDDAEDACNGFTQNIEIPPVGTHVQVTGVYVLDNEHGWNEIHPVTKIEVIP